MGSEGFWPLVVARAEALTANAVALTFAVPAPLASTFSFHAGQFLTVRLEQERRSYSICSPVGAPLRVAVLAVPGGAVSTRLVRAVRPGDRLDVAPPSGRFGADLNSSGLHVLLAAGSGITPLLSIASTVLAADATSNVVLIYGNRRTDTVMFADELADLKDTYPARLHLVHVLSREEHEVGLLHGRLDPAKLRTLLPAVVNVPEVDAWWLCGPAGMVFGAEAVLRAWAVPPARVHRELFYVESEPPPPVRRPREPVGAGAAVTVTLNGRASTVTVPPGVAVLDAAQRVRPDLPFACKGGVCGTCRAQVTHGQVRMRRNYALEPAEVAAGFVLTCQAMVQSADAGLDYDR